MILPTKIKSSGTYEALPTSNDEDDTVVERQIAETPTSQSILTNLRRTTRRIRPLVIPYMAPLFLVYVSEYTINQAIPRFSPILTAGSNSHSALPVGRHAFQSNSRCLSNLPNSLPVRRIYLSLFVNVRPYP